MAGIDLPEEIILQILFRLPVKSLLRFTCVSKQWRFVIKSDLEFSKSQYKLASQHKTLTRRLLCLSHDPEQFVSLDMEMPASSLGDESLYRKVNLPFMKQGGRVTELGSCNGLVFLVVHVYACKSEFYVCNPSTGFFKQLPSPVSKENDLSYSIGVGYVSAIDDYKVLTAYPREGTRAEAIQIFSLKARCWKRIENVVETGLLRLGHTAALCNEKLHWLNHDDRGQLFAFDLAKEELKRMALPDFFRGYDMYSSDIVVSHEGCLSVMRYTMDSCHDSIESILSIHFWVMREYGVHDSWTKLFNLKLSNPLNLSSWIRIGFLVTDCSTFGWTDTQLTRIDHKEEEKHGLALCVLRGHQICVTDYEESLLWIN